MRKQHTKANIVISLLLVLLVAACSSKPIPTPELATPGPAETDMSAVYTQAYQTIVAELEQTAVSVTQQVPATGVAEVVQPSATHTDIPLPPTSTPLPTNTPLPSDTPTPTETALPTEMPTPVDSPTPTEPPEPTWQVKLEDDFAATKAWTTTDQDAVSFRYTVGGYIIHSKVNNFVVFSVRNDFYNDTRIEVDASRLKGPSDGYYGVICRFVDGGNYYMLGVGSDGWYGILKHKTNKIEALQEGYDTTGKVFTGGTLNRIRADCFGNKLVLYANGQKVASVQDTDFSAGQYGLAVGTRNATEYQVLFDNLILYAPQE